MATETSLSSQVCLCCAELESLRDKLIDPSAICEEVPAFDIQEQCERLELWATDLGAFILPKSQASLDHRLREAPQIRKQVQQLLTRLQYCASRAKNIFTGNLPNRQEDDLGSELDDSNELIVPSETCRGQVSEVEELCLSICGIITRLFRLSTVIKNPTPRTRYAAWTLVRPTDSVSDILRIKDKFVINADNEWLAERLGKAVTQRREYLLHRQDHDISLVRKDSHEPEDTPIRHSPKPYHRLQKPSDLYREQEAFIELSASRTLYSYHDEFIQPTEPIRSRQRNNDVRYSKKYREMEEIADHNYKTAQEATQRYSNAEVRLQTVQQQLAASEIRENNLQQELEKTRRELEDYRLDRKYEIRERDLRENSVKLAQNEREFEEKRLIGSKSKLGHKRRDALQSKVRKLAILSNTHPEFDDETGSEPSLNSDTQALETSTTTMYDKSTSKIRMPVPPGNPDPGSYFVCPYCSISMAWTNQRVWEQHVFGDLRPYICTFDSCSAQPFASETEWFDHELKIHRREWICMLCDTTPFRSVASFQDHLKSAHAEEVTENQIPAVIDLCEEPVDRFNLEECPLCDKQMTNVEMGELGLNSSFEDTTTILTTEQFRQHLGSHLEQVALIGLPRLHKEEHFGSYSYDVASEVDDSTESILQHPTKKITV